ncbi:SH3 domain-containing protein [Streptomyces sp. SID12488]|uniref:SH3 domain-containing protein n=1 Tax=Streptomyces sp. SID12488 TaxID=2706040 RepID=UPI0013DAF5DC|nr:SH3 domain-containing protein [Streptomyces sp. SID12488]NEA64627.1 SH3 domain-containing protein [Streptomyces sp. SID12488]
MNIRRFTAIAVVAAVCTMAAPAVSQAAAPDVAKGAVVAAASANTLGHFTGDGVNIRSGPGTGYSSLGQGQSGQGVEITCYYYANFGDSGQKWYYLKNKATGVIGFVSSAYIKVTSGGVGYCP